MQRGSLQGEMTPLAPVGGMNGGTEGKREGGKTSGEERSWWREWADIFVKKNGPRSTKKNQTDPYIYGDDSNLFLSIRPAFERAILRAQRRFIITTATITAFAASSAGAGASVASAASVAYAVSAAFTALAAFAAFAAFTASTTTTTITGEQSDFCLFGLFSFGKPINITTRRPRSDAPIKSKLTRIFPLFWLALRTATWSTLSHSILCYNFQQPHNASETRRTNSKR